MAPSSTVYGTPAMSRMARCRSCGSPRHLSANASLSRRVPALPRLELRAAAALGPAAAIPPRWLVHRAWPPGSPGRFPAPEPLHSTARVRPTASGRRTCASEAPRQCGNHCAPQCEGRESGGRDQCRRYQGDVKSGISPSGCGYSTSEEKRITTIAIAGPTKTESRMAVRASRVLCRNCRHDISRSCRSCGLPTPIRATARRPAS
jgi:hypothetical protein